MPPPLRARARAAGGSAAAVAECTSMGGVVQGSSVGRASDLEPQGRRRRTVGAIGGEDATSIGASCEWPRSCSALRARAARVMTDPTNRPVSR
eukprot:2508017-Prymnesium_polylepis.1